jgi:prepilin-type processing-associated H-X9-DG protein
MVACGFAGIQVDTQGRTYPLPSIQLGVGIYWADFGNSSPDWDAKSFKTSVVKDPSGAILLVEEPNRDQPVGNVWPCVSIGPVGTGSFTALYQIDSNYPASSGNLYGNQGSHTYQLHGGRFNYLFHDNHVGALRIEQTIGTGTLANPKGMWTVAKGD